jgi:hypothetical protein
MSCCICGTVKNCAPYLNKVLSNIEKIATVFTDYKILIYYDKSNDNTLKILKEYQTTNPKMLIYVNKKLMSKYRTHNLALARNFCLNYVKENKEQYPFFIMMDMDDVNCKEYNPNIINKYLSRTDWDGLSFNSSPKYYDIWGLSKYPYCFSYNHFDNNDKYYTIIQNYITNLLNKLPQDGLLQCLSSFNGFSIYRTSKFLNTNYDGHVRLDLVSKHNLKAHINAAKSQLLFKNYGNVNGLYEDCEHRAFHLQAIKIDNARIMISPEIIFS